MKLFSPILPPTSRVSIRRTPMKRIKKARKSKLLTALTFSAVFFVGCLIFSMIVVPGTGSVKAVNSRSTHKALTQTTFPKNKVPANLNEAHEALLKALPQNIVVKMKNGPEEDMADYYMSLGTKIRNEWGLKQDSRLSRYFTKIGVTHPDDMSEIILDTFWLKLNGKPVPLKEKAKYYQDYWAGIDKQNETIEVKGIIKPSYPLTNKPLSNK